ncbi:unnamed protein product, partial [Laminaria digitata]
MRCAFECTTLLCPAQWCPLSLMIACTRRCAFAVLDTVVSAPFLSSVAGLTGGDAESAHAVVRWVSTLGWTQLHPLNLSALRGTMRYGFELYDIAVCGTDV